MQHPTTGNVLHTAREHSGQRADDYAGDRDALPNADAGDDGDARLPPGEESAERGQTKDTDPVDEAEALETTDRLPKDKTQTSGRENKEKEAAPEAGENRTGAARKKPGTRRAQKTVATIPAMERRRTGGRPHQQKNAPKKRNGDTEAP